MFTATILLVLTLLCPALSALKGSEGVAKGPVIPSPGHPIWSAQIDFTKPHNTPWNDADLATIAKAGMNRVEINMDWSNIEPQRDHYDFTLLDRTMACAAKSHLKLLLLFWESIYGVEEGKNPPPWLKARDLTSDGITAAMPPWWDPDSRKAYFDYVSHTIDHVKNNPGFGGVYASYGWLDSEWGPPPKGSNGVTGYAPADIEAFYRWLPEEYKTLANFNRIWKSSYKDWRSIPVSRPGDPLFAVYQRFRFYSAEKGFDDISRLVREHTDATLLYSWGGWISGRLGPEVQGNDPDTFFRNAKKYHAIILLDDADTSGLALLFGSMARDYKVPLIQEWTPVGTDLFAEIPQWLGHIGLASPFEVGEDFYIYPPTPGSPSWAAAWAAYQEWHSVFTELIKGRTPEQPVAVLVPTLKIALSTDLNAFAGLNEQLTAFWRHSYVLPHFITDQEVANGVVSLQQFKAIVDLGDERADLPALKAYAEKHPVLKSLDQMGPYLRPYAVADPPSDTLELVPTVQGSLVWLSLGNCSKNPYSGTIRFDPAAVGLGSASFSVKDAKTGQLVNATRSSDGKVQWHIDMPSASLRVLKLSLSNSVSQ